MPLSAVDAVSPATQHAKQQLLQPFRWGQWSRLALVGFLAGVGGLMTVNFLLEGKRG